MPTRGREPENNSPKKIIAFDLDETLGYFSEFGIFHDAVEQFTGNVLTRTQSFKIFELYEKELVRPKMMSILRTVMGMKRSNIIDYVMIYTNNQGGEAWTYMIKDYFEYKLGMGKIFDKIICAYKIMGRRDRQCEDCRTTHSKTYNDLVVNCCKFPKSTKVCFVDDQNHPYMKNHPNVYYLRVTPYIYSLTPQTFIERFLETRLLSAKIKTLGKGTEFTTHVLRYFNRVGYYNYTPKTTKSLKSDQDVSNKLAVVIRKFESF
jgi:hypothetical protein